MVTRSAHTRCPDRRCPRSTSARTRGPAPQARGPQCTSSARPVHIQCTSSAHPGHMSTKDCPVDEKFRETNPRAGSHSGSEDAGTPPPRAAVRELPLAPLTPATAGPAHPGDPRPAHPGDRSSCSPGDRCPAHPCDRSPCSSRLPTLEPCEPAWPTLRSTHTPSSIETTRYLTPGWLDGRNPGTLLMDHSRLR